MAYDTNHCSFVLLAEFDIDRGAMLTYQFPQPLGTDELLLANLMLPDGAEKQLEDWTIFFLNQTPFNTISPVLALETPESDDGVRSELLYVLNLVRTKHDKSVRRYFRSLHLFPSHFQQRCRRKGNGNLHEAPFHPDFQGHLILCSQFPP
jgi:hypothetical protein